MTVKYFGVANECPHKTVSRFYDSPIAPVGLWRCDWCGYEFRPVEVESGSKTVELTEAEKDQLAICSEPVRQAKKREEVAKWATEPSITTSDNNAGFREIVKVEDAPKVTKKKEKSYAS